jgi:hypothetical protein
MRTLPPEEMKEVCTIKQESSLKMLKEIMMEKSSSPIAIVKKGCSFHPNIYRREIYKHKLFVNDKKRNEKVEVLAR